MPSVTTWMDLEGIMLREMSQTILYDLTYMWTLTNNKKKKKNFELIDTENRLLVARPGR